MGRAATGVLIMVRVGTLKMRVEGDFWFAYYALPGAKMTEWVHLGSIHMSACRNEVIKTAFFLLMREAVSDIIENATGIRPVWPHAPVPGPENERTQRG